MSKKIVFTPEQRQEIEEFIQNTYQCTLRHISQHFGYSRHSLENNLGKDFIKNKLFHGVSDETKEKLREINLGKKQSEETVRKRVEGTRKTHSTRTEEELAQQSEKRKQSKITNYGSVENFYKHVSQKTKETKLKRYGDPNYNNMEKNKQTKSERYGDPNYNNFEQITKTQFEKYGGYAFQDKEKYEKTMLERYGVSHNWSSDDPKLNGQETKYKKYGSKEEYCNHTLSKGRETRKILYGYEFYSNSEQAQQTMLQKYGVPYFCMTNECQQEAHTIESAQKRIETMKKNNSFNQSLPEKFTYELLVEKFGKDDVYKEYTDSRYADESGYMFKCDFYIKSLDMFIELNLHPTHRDHPFDSSNEEDINILKVLKDNPTQWNLTVIDVWGNRDVKKRAIAIQQNLNYIIIYPNDNIAEIINSLR